MESINKYLLYAVLTLTTLCNVVVSNTSIRQYVSKERIHIGDTWTLSCLISSDKRENVLFKLFKKYGSTEYEIGVNSFLDPAFQDTGRYTINLEVVSTQEESPMELNITLQITNAQPSDSGVIGCSIPSDALYASKSLTVYSPVSEVKLTMGDPQGDEFKYSADGQTLEFPEGKIQSAMCRVHGGYPKPKVTMKAGDRYITDQFELKQDLVGEGDIPALQVRNYRTSLLKEDFNLTFAVHNKILKCSVKIPGSGFPTVEKQFKIRLTEYKPQFECGAFIAPAVIGKKYELSCIAHGLPPVDELNVFWETEDNEQLGQGGQGGQGSHFKAIVEPMDTEERTKITLKIDKITKRHFRDYVFYAKNSIGETEQKIAVSRRRSKGAGMKASDCPNWRISYNFVFLFVAIATWLIGQ